MCLGQAENMNANPGDVLEVCFETDSRFVVFTHLPHPDGGTIVLLMNNIISGGVCMGFSVSSTSIHPDMFVTGQLLKFPSGAVSERPIRALKLNGNLFKQQTLVPQ